MLRSSRWEREDMLDPCYWNSGARVDVCMRNSHSYEVPECIWVEHGCRKICWNAEAISNHSRRARLNSYDHHRVCHSAQLTKVLSIYKGMSASCELLKQILRRERLSNENLVLHMSICRYHDESVYASIRSVHNLWEDWDQHIKRPVLNE